MKEHTKVAAVQEQACAVLRSLSASNANNRIEIAAKGGIVAVLAAMKEHPEVANVQKKACGVLCILFRHNDNKIDIVAKGGMAAILAAMTQHRRWQMCKYQHVGRC